MAGLIWLSHSSQLIMLVQSLSTLILPLINSSTGIAQHYEGLTAMPPIRLWSQQVILAGTISKDDQTAGRICKTLSLLFPCSQPLVRSQ
jgi:hypothetical protein